MQLLTKLKHNWSKVLSVLFFTILFGVYAYTFATPPATKYSAGETLDPTCAPGDPNCSVDIPGLSYTDFSSTSPLSYDNTTGTFSISQSSSTTDGYLSSLDWNTFNNKISSQWITSGNDIYYTLGNIYIGNNHAYQSLNSTGTPISLMFLASDISGISAGDILNIGNPITGSSINFYTGGQVVGTNERMTIAGNGFVGVGTTSPSTELHLVRKSGGFTERIDSYGSNSILNLNRASGSLTSPTIPGSGGKLGSINFGAWGGTSFTNVSSIQSSIDANSGSGDLPTNLTFFTTPDGSATQIERLRITNAGNIGINTSSPSAGLHFVTSNSTTSLFDNYGNYSGIKFRRANGTTASPTGLLSGETIMSMTGTGHNGVSMQTANRVEISGLTTENWDANAQGTALRFSTTTTGTKLLTERMRIDGIGNVGIGTYSPQARLHIAGGDVLVENNRYLSFDDGNGNYGVDSYGFRDNAGSIEYKDLGGTWTSLSSLQDTLPITIINSTNLFSTGLEETATDVTNTTNDSILLGRYTGYQATNTTQSIFIGSNAGYRATGVDTSNFIGIIAGYQASGSSNSNFMGAMSGSNVNVTDSNFFGSSAGSAAYSASYSNFLGNSAGAYASSGNNSNFLGRQAGYVATNASNSNFFSYQAGFYATNASYSNFFGVYSGRQASNASYSNLFGYQAGKTFTGNNIGSNNIIIGTNISLGDAVANSMNIGGVLFGTGFQSDTSATNPYIVPTSGGKIGILNTAPAYTLHVGNSSISGIVSRFENSTGTCDINPTSSSLSCSSDINLKKNITNIKDNTDYIYNDSIVIDNDNTSILYKLNLLTPVKYNWNKEDDNDTKHIGFIAQEVEQIFPDLVSTDPETNLKSVSYTNFIPYTISAIQEMDLKVREFGDMDVENDWRDSVTIWLSNATNKISRIFTGEICLTDDGGTECINRAELKSLKELLIQNQNSNTSDNNSNIDSNSGNSLPGDTNDNTESESDQTLDGQTTNVNTTNTEGINVDNQNETQPNTQDNNDTLENNI